VILPVLGLLALAYWLAAPDPVTAGARTASGTAARAAGTGARSHWAAGRGQRQARRTKRRDRWWQAGGVRRAALRAEHAGVWSWGAGKTAAGVTAAAVRPVPSAVKDGWNRGQDRHRAKAGNRPAPVALDLPWWHREQPEVQPEEQDTGTAQEQGPEQVQVQPGNSPEVQPPHPSGLPPEQRCQWCDDRAATTKRGKLEVCDPCGGEIDGQVSQAIRDHHVTDLPGIGGDHEPDRYTATTRRLPDGSYRGELFYSGLPEEGDQPLVTVDRPTEAEVRHELADVASGIQDDDAHGVPARIAWVPLGENGEPPSPYGEPLSSVPEGDTRTSIPADLRCQRCDAGRRRYTYDGIRVCGPCSAELDREADLAAEPLNSAPAPADGPTDGAPAPDTTTPTTEGDPMFNRSANVPTVELNDLDSVKRFTEYVAALPEDSEFMQIVEQCKVIRENFRGGGFGGDMDAAGTAYEESAAALATAVAEFADQSTQYAGLAANVAGG
jgi:hypothetical protein